MSAPDFRWFEALSVDPEAVARVGFGLLDYADDYESVQPGEVEVPSIERRLLEATTLKDAAQLLVLVDPMTAAHVLARAADLYQSVGAPEAWTAAIASDWASDWAWGPPAYEHGEWAPPPSGAVLPLLQLFLEPFLAAGLSGPAWLAPPEASETNAPSGWSESGVPAELFSQFARHAREFDVDGMAQTLDRVAESADVTIRFAQENDEWRWKRFLSDAPPVDLELVALGVIAVGRGPDLRDRLEQHLTPARVSVLAGMTIAENFPEPPEL